MKVRLLDDRTAVLIKNGASEFLNGLTTNVPDAPKSAFVDLHGRIVAVFYQKRLNADESLIVIGSAFFERLLKHLDKFLKLGDTAVEKDGRRIYFCLEGGYEPGADEIMIPEKKGFLLVTSKTVPAAVSREEFDLFRLENNIPFQGVDYDEELLLNLDDESYVSYVKGCYLGQEIIARVHYRAKPPKRLVVRSSAECTKEERARMTSRAPDPATGKELGFVFIPSE